MKNVVVFGGSGFLGSYVVDELLARDFNVTIADINPSIYHEHKCRYVKTDILNAEEVEAVITTETDIVYNYAGFSDVGTANENLVLTAQLNIIGNLYILEACRKSRVKRFIYASSAYANSEKGSFYGTSKLSSEKFIEKQHQLCGLEYTILRYGSVYGDRGNEANGIYRLIKQAIENKRIIHPGNGEEVREYIHCRDAAALSVDILDPMYKNLSLILTGVEKLKYKDLLIMLKEIFNDEIDIEYSDKPLNSHYFVTPYSFKPSMALKMVRNPYIDLGQGLLECITSLHKKLHVPKNFEVEYNA